jgi:hypothetical protein
VAIGATFIIDSDFGEETTNEQPPFFYNIPEEDIVHIMLEYNGDHVGFTYREELRRWFFDEEEDFVDIPANLFRFGGITTLLGGPRTKRLLNTEINNPSEYGLDDPISRYTITLSNNSQQVLLVGDQTPNGESTYAQVEGLIDTSWSEVLNRLVQVPPIPDWLYTLEPSTVREILLFEENEITRGYSLDRDAGTYFLCTIPIEGDPCTGTVEADQDAFQAALSLIADHKIDGAAALNLIGEDEFEQFGTGQDDPYFTIRVEQQSDIGSSVTDVTQISMIIGDVTPDGLHRYAVGNETSDVIYIDREWGDQLLELFRGDPLVPASS